MPAGDPRPETWIAHPIPDDVLERLFRNGRTNALLAWTFVGVLGLVFLESLVDFDVPWVLFVAGTGAVVLVPPLAHRDWRVMLPWEVLVVALLPILVRGIFRGELGTFATYLAIGGLALVITVELHMFTPVSVTHWFAVTFVVLTTLASAAVWTIVRWSSDRIVDTAYLTTNEALMGEYVSVALAGVAAGVLFDAYFRRRGRRLRRAIRRVVRP